MVEFNLSKIIKSIKNDESSFQEFLVLLSKHYNYSLDQLFVLYEQGYRGDEDLCGYEYIKSNKKDSENFKPYICILESGISLTLFGIPEGGFSSIKRGRTGSNFNIYNKTRLNGLIGRMKDADAIVVQDEPGLNGYRMSDDENDLYMDLENKGKIRENIENIISVVIDRRISVDKYKSVFTKEVVRSLWLRQELKSYDIVEKSSCKDLHELLNDAFKEYQKIYFIYEKKYLTIDEIVILNQYSGSYNSDSDFILAITMGRGDGLPDIPRELQGKFKIIGKRGISKIYEDSRKDKLIHYPEYNIR